MLKNNSIKIPYYILCILFCYPVLKLQIANGMIVLFFISCVLSYFKFKTASNKKSIFELIVYLSLFIAIATWCLFVDQNPESIFYLEKSLSLLVFPLSFYLLPYKLNQSQKKRLYILFISSTFLSVIAGLIYTSNFFYVILSNKLFANASEMFSSPSFSHLLRSNFEAFTGLHPTYASIYLSISFLILFNHIIQGYQNISKKTLLLIALCLFIIILLMAILASRTPFIALLICSTILFSLYQKSRKKVLYLIIGLGVFCFTLLIFVPSLSSRFKEVSIQNLTKPNEQNQNSFNIRSGIYSCGLEIIKDNWLIGVGPGNLQNKLNTCYNKISKDVYQNQNYNTHNQLIDYWASMGIFGLFGLLIMIYYLISINIKVKSFLPATFFILMLICMQTENILSRHSGVVIFGIFVGMFGFKHKSDFKPNDEVFKVH